MASKKEKAAREMGRVRTFFNEFKTFAIKGNMLDMAVGMIVGGAFTAFITSIVTNIATPLIGIFIGVDFSGWTITLPHLYGTNPPGELAIGAFLNSAVSFIVVAFIVFLFVKAINKFRSNEDKKPPAPPEPSKEELLLTEIRDLLRDNMK